jgi:hypothetical protein
MKIENGGSQKAKVNNSDAVADGGKAGKRQANRQHDARKFFNFASSLTLYSTSGNLEHT